MVEYMIETENIKDTKKIILNINQEENGRVYIYANNHWLITFSVEGNVFTAEKDDFIEAGLKLHNY